ncbi:hypothetical protein [Klebsiella variicola]|uniref:hypothetical protein n=1 Tax=Klebsiella variicola TaxID=244366 RepID=UPI000D747003|nr:hypothetical protein DMT40_24925 [Klebsiella variicola]
MTITLQAVNELIASLESAGELSIREQKFLKLAKAFKQIAAENVALKNAITDHSHSVHFCEVCGKDDPCSTDDVCYALKDIPATDRIVAGFKADGVAEREKTITFTAAKKRTQDGVALIAIGKPYKIHNDDVIGEFFIGERGRYGVITMDRLDYFTASDEYTWEFSLREGAK